MRLGLAEEADRNLVEALAIAPGHAPSLEQLAELRLGQGRLEDVVELSDRLLALHPDAVLAWLRKGTALFRLGRLDEAAGALGEAVRRAPGLGIGFGLLAEVELGRGRPAEAVAAARRAVELMPEVSRPHAVLALALEATADHAGAVIAAERAVSLDPTGQARRHLAPVLGPEPGAQRPDAR
jgi:tetratricopeptide (TPR) repeat protein